MKYCQPIYWHSGLHLQPQHFQLTDIQQQYWNHRYIQLTSPFFWGVVSFKLDLQALANFELSVIKAVFLFPDGALVDCEINGVLPTRPLQKLLDRYSKPMPFYVGLRNFHPGQANVEASEELSTEEKYIKRWTLQGNTKIQRDLFGNGPDADIQTLSYHLRFFIDNEEAEGYTLLPLGILNFEGNCVELDDSVMVPCLTLNATPAIEKWINSFCKKVISKIRKLETLKLQGSASSKCSKDDYRMLMTVLQILSRYAVLLCQYQQTEHQHPRFFYNAVQQLNAELTSVNPMSEEMLSDELSETIQTSWDHHHPGDSFIRISKRFDHIINKLFNVSDSRVFFKLASKGYYSATLENIDTKVSSQIYLCLYSERLPLLCENTSFREGSKLCSPEQLENLISYSLPGVSFSYINRLPHKISVVDSTSCFLIDQRDELWNMIIDVNEITLYWTDAPDDLQVSLIFCED
jgi:type VI secretion system protein ImpJ